jgi:hypothetical protein
MDWLNHPAVQGGVGPLVVALIVGFALSGTRYAWLGIAASYLTAVALSTGFAFSPLTASRKILVLGIATPLVGIAIDQLWPQAKRAALLVIAAIAGVLSVWVVSSVLMQGAGTSLYVAAAGIALFTAVLTALMLALRNDGLRTGAAGLGLGLAAGIAAVISASVGFLLFGVSIAAAAGALLLVQVLRSRNIVPGVTGALSIGLLVSLFAVGTLMLAEMPWYALPLLWLVPLATMIPVSDRVPLMARAALLALFAVLAAIIPIAAAWFSARGSFT